MKIIRLKIQPARRTRLFLLGAALLIILLAFAWRAGGQTGIDWQDNLSWQVNIYQRADQMKITAPPWLLVNELNMTLNSNEPVGWLLTVRDADGRELYPGITELQVLYSSDLKIVAGTAFRQNAQPVMSLPEFCQKSLYNQEFFDISLEQRLTLSNFWLGRSGKVDLNKDKDQYSHWEKGQPWWSQYQSVSPPLRGELVR